MKTIKKLAHKVEGVGFDIAGGVARIKERIGPDHSPKGSDGGDASLHQGPPMVTSVPSFARHLEGALSMEGMKAPGARSELFMKDSTAPHPQHSQAWWCGEEGCDYLSIFVRDAKDLAIMDFETHSASA